MFYIGIVILVKGLWSVFSSFLAKFYFDNLGWIDIVSGTTLMLLFYGKDISFFWIFGIAILVKGLWSILFSV